MWTFHIAWAALAVLNGAYGIYLYIHYDDTPRRDDLADFLVVLFTIACGFLGPISTAALVWAHIRYLKGARAWQ